MVLLRFPSFFGIFRYVYISCCQSNDNFTYLWQKRWQKNEPHKLKQIR